jgi:hypothetical protein
VGLDDTYVYRYDRTMTAEPDSSPGSAAPSPQPRQGGLTRALTSWRWPLVTILLALLGYLAYQQGCDAVRSSQQMPAETVRELGEAAATIAERFQTGQITTTFVSALPHLLPEGGSKLELAAYETVETFTRSDDRRVLFDLVPLGTTVTEIRVPVTYRYHLRLDDPWHLLVSGQTCVVHAPSFRPTLPPAIDTARLEKHAESGWLRFNEDEQMEELERTITPSLSIRAGNPEHMNLIREECRQRVADFVRSWLLREDHWREDRFSSVIVIFADEEIDEEVAQPPTIELDDL